MPNKESQKTYAVIKLNKDANAYFSDKQSSKAIKVDYQSSHRLSSLSASAFVCLKNMKDVECFSLSCFARFWALHIIHSQIM